MRSLGATILILAAVAGCVLDPAGDADLRREVPCEDRYPSRRCDAILADAAVQAGVDEDAVVGIDILPGPTNPPGLIMVTSGGRSIDVRVRVVDGPPRIATIHCAGSPMGIPACMDEPRYFAYAPTGPGAGYRDVPCPGTPPGGCATPLPTLEPDAVAQAQPLRIDRLEVRVTGTGPQEVELGRGSLPNGVLTEGTFELADGWPPGLRLRDGVALELRPADPDVPPYQNYYDHGWRPGVEEFVAVLRFDAVRAEPGAVLTIRDLIVR